MEHKTPGVGSPAGLSSAFGNGSPEQQRASPRPKRGRSGKRADRGEADQEALTIAGVAWRPAGGGQALVVIARGRGDGQMRSSFARLTISHGDQTVPVTAPVTVAGGDAAGRQTLRFVFAVPPSAPGWPIERMVLRWRGTETEIPAPAQAPGGGSAESVLFPPPATVADPAGAASGTRLPADERPPAPLEDVAGPVEEHPPAPVESIESVGGEGTEDMEGRYGASISAEQDLTSLRDEIGRARLELARLEADIARARLQYEEACTARDHAQSERDRAQHWLLSVADELQDVEGQLAQCRRELDHVTRELAARRAEGEPSPPALGPPPEGGAERTGDAGGELSAALAELRSKLEQVIGQPRPAEARFDPKEAPVADGSRAAPAEEAPVADGSRAAPAEEALRDTAPEEAGLERSLLEIAADEPPPDAAGETVDAVLAPATEPAGHASAERRAGLPTPASLPGQTEGEERETSWFADALRRLAEEDAEAAGRVLVSVLPAQAIATPRTFHYDLVVREHCVYAVDAHPLDTHVERLDQPRSLNETEAWIMGSLDQLGQLILEGKSGFFRLFHRHSVKVKGQRNRLDDLIGLALAPLRLRDLCAVGAPIEPQLLLRMITSSIDPAWIESQPVPSHVRRVWIRLDPLEDDMRAASLRIQDGSAVVLGIEAAAAADFGELTTTVRGSARSMMRLLAGLPSPEGDQPTVTGPAEPLELVQGWVRRLELSSL